MSINPIRAVTLVVRDAAAAAERYAQCFDYRMVDEGRVDDMLASSWCADASAGRAFTVVRPASGRKVDIRFVDGDAVEDYRPLRTYGWAAIEICIRDVAAVHERMRSTPFAIIGPPSAIASLPTIHPMQVEGPDREIVYLTEIRDDSPASGLPVVDAPIDRVFICVLACRDMAAQARWFADRLGIHVADEMTIPYRMLNRAFSLPETTLHRLATADRDGAIFLEFDQYPEAAMRRPQHRGQLPPGVAICTLSHRSLDQVPGPWLTAPTPRAGPIYEGRRVGVLRAPEGALVEVVEESP